MPSGRSAPTASTPARRTTHGIPSSLAGNCRHHPAPPRTCLSRARTEWRYGAQCSTASTPRSMTSRRARELLGRHARLIELSYFSENALALMERMDLPVSGGRLTPSYLQLTVREPCPSRPALPAWPQVPAPDRASASSQLRGCSGLGPSGAGSSWRAGRVLVPPAPASVPASPDPASAARNGPIRSPSWAACRNGLSGRTA
jgi:hypothetical protein